MSVEIIKVAMFKDESINSNKIWGIAKINNSLVTFWGRRNSTLRFKTMPGLTGKVSALNTLTKKINKGYFLINDKKLINMLIPNIEKNMQSNFFSAMSRGKLNTRH